MATPAKPLANMRRDAERLLVSIQGFTPDGELFRQGDCSALIAGPGMTRGEAAAIGLRSAPPAAEADLFDCLCIEYRHAS